MKRIVNDKNTKPIERYYYDGELLLEIVDSHTLVPGRGEEVVIGGVVYIAHRFVNYPESAMLEIFLVA